MALDAHLPQRDAVAEGEPGGLPDNRPIGEETMMNLRKALIGAASLMALSLPAFASC